MSMQRTGARNRSLEPHRQDDFVAVPYLRQGQLISLIRWSLVGGEWKYTTILAEYLHRDEGSWYLVINGSRAKLDRSEWAIFN
ncbi:hypothetical protein [Leifsonia sp. 1010]|jgi:hypothetical protein|uniref:hypothetical protein n=1 Tax=Leifsonia sp. 1010 TaxID=2817769 RepID=UPI002866E098|nr:hypothetical protein [Leifsonia sp. 1010]MDR6611404.1 hypothetical protein [Leifsonia sp. 1010]